MTLDGTHVAPLAAPASATPMRSLVLAGGGMRVAYQAGVLRALEERGLTFAHGDGTSGGTMNLAMLLSGIAPAEMCERWRTLDPKQFVSLIPIEQYLDVLGMPSWGDADGIVEKVFPHLGIDADRITRATGLAGTFNVCNYTRKTCDSLPHERITRDLLVAGISLPIFMAPVSHEGSLYIDAVWIKDANLMEAVRRGAEEIWLVWCIGNHGVYQGGAFHQYVHMIEMSANGALFEEMDRIRDINERIERGEQVGGRTEPIVLHVIKPEYPLPLDPDYYFGRISGAALVDLGYSDAVRYLDAMTPAGVPFTSDATRMRDPRPGITFSETLSGPIAIGVSDGPSEMTARVRVTISDLDAFLGGASHAGVLTGDVDFAPWGQRIPISRGTFSVRRISDTPRVARIEYGMSIASAARPHWLSGFMELRDDPGLDLLGDVTTMHATLHDGDASGRIVGEGTLRMGLGAIAKAAVTAQAIGCDSVVERVETVARFAKFVAGERTVAA